MTKPQKTAVGHEFVEYILRDWAEKLWKLNNKDRMTDETASREVEKEFTRKLIPANNLGLTKGEAASSTGFHALITGLVYTVGFVSHRAVDALTDNSLVAAWRKSVHRNNFRHSYQAIEEVIVDSIAKNGANATLAAFPKLNTYSHEEVAAELDYMNYQSKNLPAGAVANLVRSAGNAQKPQPKTAAPATP